MNELWELAKQDFEPDGALRDVYVLNTNVQDWQKVLTFLQTSDVNLLFQTVGMPAVIAKSVTTIFKHNKVERSVLSLDLIGINLNCHFFDEHEIEFDFDPRDIKDWQDFERLLNFMKQLGQAVRKEVLISYENYRKATFLKLAPTTNDVQFIPAKMV